MNTKKQIKSLAIINAVIFGVMALILFNDASLRALAAEYAIPSLVTLAIMALLIAIARNADTDEDDNDMGMDMLSPSHNFIHTGFKDDNEV